MVEPKHGSEVSRVTPEGDPRSHDCPHALTGGRWSLLVAAGADGDMTGEEDVTSGGLDSYPFWREIRFLSVSTLI